MILGVPISRNTYDQCWIQSLCSRKAYSRYNRTDVGRKHRTSRQTQPRQNNPWLAAHWMVPFQQGSAASCWLVIHVTSFLVPPLLLNETDANCHDHPLPILSCFHLMGLIEFFEWSLWIILNEGFLIILTRNENIKNHWRKKQKKTCSESPAQNGVDQYVASAATIDQHICIFWLFQGHMQVRKVDNPSEVVQAWIQMINHDGSCIHQTAVSVHSLPAVICEC